MPLEEAYQQAILNGTLQSLVQAAGGFFQVALLYNGVELSGNGYLRPTIVTIPEAGSAGVNGLVTVRLLTAAPLTAVGGSLTWNQLQLLDATGTDPVFPTFATSGTINSGESKKVAAVFGLPDNSDSISRITALENQVSSLESQTTSLGNSITEIQEELDAPTLGLVALLPDGTGYTVEDGTENVEKLNAFTVSQGWQTNRCEIDIRAKRIPMAGTDPWYISRISGVSLATTGLGGTFSENQYGSASGAVYNTGGLASGFVWVDPDNIDGPMIESEGYGVHAANLLIQGKSDPEDPTRLVQDLHLRKEEGLRITGRDAAGILSTGKNIGNLTIALCKTGIRTVATPFEDNADQLLLGRLRGHYCDTIFKSENKQTLGCRFSYIDQLESATGFEFIRGGKNWVGTHCLQRGSDIGLNITGIAGNIIGSFTTDNFIFDGTSETDALALRIQPASGYIAPSIIYSNVEVDPNISSDRINNPLFSMSGFYGDLVIQKGSGLFEECIHLTGGTTNFHPKIFFYNCSFKVGNNLNVIRNLFTSTSSGVVEITFVDNYEAFGGGSSVNDGRLYNNYSDLMTL